MLHSHSVSLDWKSLHSLVGAEPLEDAPVVFTGVNSLAEAVSGEVSFLGNPRYVSQLADTGASAVLVPAGDYEVPEGCHLITVDDPSGAFSRVIGFFQKERREFRPGVSPAAHVAEDVIFDPVKVRIDPGAVIEEGCHIGDGTMVGAGCLIGRGVTIGNDCHLHPGAVVREGCRLGHRVILQPGAVVGSDGFGYRLVEGRHEKVPQVGVVEIEDDVEVGANSCIDRARFGKTVIGEGTKIDNLVQVAHNVTVGKHCLLVAQSGVAGSTSLGNYVTIAAQSGVAGHLRIGDQVVLAGKSGFLKDVQTPGVYLGMPARPIVEEQRKMASLARLPKLRSEFQLLKKKLEQKTGG